MTTITGNPMSEGSSGKLPQLQDTDAQRLVFFIGGVRSGTTVFRRMMASHPQIRDRGEVFNSNNPVGYFRFLREQVARDPELIFPERSPEVFGAYLLSLLPKEPDAMALVDIKYEHLNLLPEAWQLPFTNPSMVRALKRSHARVIHLRRQHFFSVISNLVAVETGRYHDRVGQEGSLPAKRTVRIDRNQLLGNMKKRRRATELIDNSLEASQRLAIDYETVFEADGTFKTDLLDQLATFLSLRPEFERQPALRKVIDEPLSEVISNYADIADLEHHAF